MILRRETSESGRKKGVSGMRKEMEKEIPERERKKGNEEIFALSRACHAVPREKKFFFFFFLSLFSPFDLTLSLSFLKSGYTLRAEYEL